MGQITLLPKFSKGRKREKQSGHSVLLASQKEATTTQTASPAVSHRVHKPTAASGTVTGHLEQAFYKPQFTPLWSADGNRPDLTGVLGSQGGGTRTALSIAPCSTKYLLISTKRSHCRLGLGDKIARGPVHRGFLKNPFLHI